MAKNILAPRHSWENLDSIPNYTVKCHCCGGIFNFGRDDVYKGEDECYIHHEYVDCPLCNEEIMLNDDEYFGY